MIADFSGVASIRKRKKKAKTADNSDSSHYSFGVAHPDRLAVGFSLDRIRRSAYTFHKGELEKDRQ
jgi:hypothetical protein